MGSRGASSHSKKSGGSGLGFKQGKEATPEEAVGRSNVQNYNTDRYYRVNCQRCVWAYEMQRRGYDVEALPSYKGDTLPSYGNWMGIGENITREYVSASWGQPNSIKTEVSNIKDVMSGWGDGSRGIVRVAWSRSNSGHVFNVEYKNGKLIGYDAQNGKVYNNLGDALRGTRRNYTQLVRSDNVVFKPSEVSKYVKERGGK